MVQNTDTKINRRRLMSEVLVGDETEDKPTSAEVQKQEKIEPNRKQYKTPIKTQQLVVEDNKFEINN
jgi:hypothetical protein